LTGLCRVGDGQGAWVRASGGGWMSAASARMVRLLRRVVVVDKGRVICGGFALGGELARAWMPAAGTRAWCGCCDVQWWWTRAALPMAER
jgi:hypothetical protein